MVSSGLQFVLPVEGQDKKCPYILIYKDFWKDGKDLGRPLHMLSFIIHRLCNEFLSAAEGSQMHKCKCPSVCPPFLKAFPLSVHHKIDMVDAYGKN